MYKSSIFFKIAYESYPRLKNQRIMPVLLGEGKLIIYKPIHAF